MCLLALLVGAMAAPASACRTYIPSADVSVIHQELPASLPPDTLVADVQFERPDGGWPELFKGARARVRRVIQGHYSGDVVIVRDAQIRITCYDPIRFGGRGYILGKPVGYENGVLVLQPVFAPQRLPMLGPAQPR